MMPRQRMRGGLSLGGWGVFGGFSRSVKRRLVVLFLLLAASLAGVFVLGAQRAFSQGWREAARPLLTDYADRLTADISGPAGNAGNPQTPSIERAQALAQRLPITVRIEGPTVNWASHPAAHSNSAPWRRGKPSDGGDWGPVLTRNSADGHRISYGFDEAAFARGHRQLGWGLGALLLITGLAYAVVRHLLKPLDQIRSGAQRFGRGDFADPIPLRHPQKPDELDDLAATVNTMADDIRQMLETKRALLLAISHELRSPLTRARLNVELLPEAADTAEQRSALLRDLAEMATLVSDLLEGERLAGRHATLQREPTDLSALAAAVLTELQARQPGASAVRLHTATGLPTLALDPTRMRLMLRNLLDNALRHGADAPCPPELNLLTGADGGVVIELRDHGPGVPADQLPRLAQAFYRPDSARTRHAGGVGLGLYLCRLVAQAHGGELVLRNAQPGLTVRVTLPAQGAQAKPGH